MIAIIHMIIILVIITITRRRLALAPITCGPQAARPHPSSAGSREHGDLANLRGLKMRGWWVDRGGGVEHVGGSERYSRIAQTNPYTVTDKATENKYSESLPETR